MEKNDEEKAPDELLEAPELEAPLEETPLEAHASVTRMGVVTVGGFFTKKLFQFKPLEMRFMREFGPDVSVEEACKKAGVPVEFAQRMLRKPSVREFLADKFQQFAIQAGWTAERWISEGDQVWRGNKIVTREQLEIWKEFGSRILPRKAPSGGSGQVSEAPQITININAVDEAFKRQKAIEAEVIDGTVGT